MTPHNEANKNEISKIVIMPGDPLRAKYISEKYLNNVKLVNKVRNMYAYTGYYKDKEVTVMASGMGIPSIGIYSYELFNDYDVDVIIRIGNCGSYSKDLNVKDIVLVNESYSESTYLKVMNNDESNTVSSSKELNEKIKNTANNLNISIKEEKVHSTDAFYTKNEIYNEIREKYNCNCVEMESFGLLSNAKVLNKKAACILTVSDSFITSEELSSKEREESLDDMIRLSLESIINM